MKIKQAGVGISGDDVVLDVCSRSLTLPLYRDCFPDMNRVAPEITEAINRVDLNATVKES